MFTPRKTSGSGGGGSGSSSGPSSISCFNGAGPDSNTAPAVDPIQNTNTISASDQAYNDVPANTWYAQDVAYVTAKDIMYGVGNNKFAPESSITRGMIVTMLYRIEFLLLSYIIASFDFGIVSV